MRKYAVMTDSTCDLGVDLLEQYQIDYAPMNYIIGTDQYPAMLDWSSHPAQEFYQMMRNGIVIKTTQVPMAEYEKHFENWLMQGLDIIYIACSSALSGSINVARITAEQILQKYPGRKIRCVDSLISSLGQGDLAIVAARMADDGKDVDETADYIESVKLQMNQAATVGSLEYLKRAGRVTATNAFFGNFLGVKPILISDALGQNYAIRKVKGALNARKELLQETIRNVINPQEQTLYISHADNLPEAELLRDEILKDCPFKNCYINYIAPIVGASVGPGTVSAYFRGREVTIKGGV